ncbi:MAG TPA: aldehyde dehydrogenase family protein, partial [Flavobacterium sp.]|nr:aldehyde dehydrogenase family protein [Flavobacterium sp.]
PDYILIQNKVKSKFIESLISEIKKAYGENPENSSDFARIINARNWERLSGLLAGQQIIFGGQSNSETRYLAPTLVDEPALDSKIMAEEIFGPLLPIISYENETEIETIISKHEKPLSLYVFTDNKPFARRIIRDFSFGGGCVNDTVVHFGNARLPFGGVGNSGIGAYHGKRSFDTFSHQKAIVKKANWLDLTMRYAPYGNKLKLLRRLLRWL